MKFFNYDSPFWSFMSRVADLVILNLLWLLFCIPVFTIGASTAAMYRVTLNMVRGEGGGVVRSFWASFKLNFKQGVLLFLILLIPTLLVIIEVEIYLSGVVAQSIWMGVVFCFPALLVSLIGAYIYPLLAQFDNTIKNTLKNAILLSIGNLPYSLVMAALNLSAPTSVAELTDMLLAFKAGDPNGNFKQDEVAADLIGVYEMRWLLPYFGVVADDSNLARLPDGSLAFAPELPAYREWIATLRDWVAQGILPQTPFTAMHSTAALSAASSDEKTPVTSGLIVTMTPYTHVPAAAAADYDALLMPDASGATRWRDLLGEVWTGCFAVSSSCEDPAAALRWVDALYGEDGALLAYSLILAINRPIEMLVTSLNVVGDATSCICVAKSEGMLDEEKYNA